MRTERLQSIESMWLIVLDTGDEVVASVTDFAREHHILGASLRGIGAFSEVRLGFFDWDSKEYRTSVDLTEQVELVSMIGDIAEKDGAPQLHVHAAVATRTGQVYGGHLQSARVRPTCELILTATPEPFRKRFDAESGIALIRP